MEQEKAPVIKLMAQLQLIGAILLIHDVRRDYCNDRGEIARQTDLHTVSSQTLGLIRLEFGSWEDKIAVMAERVVRTPHRGQTQTA